MMDRTLTDIQRQYERTGEGPSGGLHYDSLATDGPFTIIPAGWPRDPATCAHETVATYPNGERVCSWCSTRWVKE